MNQYESLIDPAEFGLIADYLRSRAPIDHIVHVKRESEIPRLAKELVHETKLLRYPCWSLPHVVERGLAEGTLLLSSRYQLKLANPKWIVDAANIPRHSDCTVLYLPPFYLAHTPGLFEGKLIRVKATQPPHKTATDRPAIKLKP